MLRWMGWHARTFFDDELFHFGTMPAILAREREREAPHIRQTLNITANSSRGIISTIFIQFLLPPDRVTHAISNSHLNNSWSGCPALFAKSCCHLSNHNIISSQTFHISHHRHQIALSLGWCGSVRVRSHGCVIIASPLFIKDHFCNKKKHILQWYTTSVGNTHTHMWCMRRVRLGGGKIQSDRKCWEQQFKCKWKTKCA